MTRLRQRVEALVSGLSEDEVKDLKRSLRIKVDDPLPDTDTLVDICTPTYIGPSWQWDDEEDDWKLPERTLGWELAAWASTYLASPDDPDKPWEFTPEQLRFLLWWYAVDERGVFLARRGVLQRLKGWGKDPLIAVICLLELLAPVRFAKWDEFGQPVGKPVLNPLVQVSAVTQEQSYNTGDMFPILVTKKAIKDYGIKMGVDLIRAKGGRAKLQMITSSPRAIEGKRTTFSVLNEALALDTPIPTPRGWATMGELVDGDVIYGSDGKPTTVVRAHEVQHGRKCYRVVFDDGNSIVASDGHWWKVRIAPNRKCSIQELTTEEMYNLNRKLYLPESFSELEGTAADNLPIDPYALGLWLGDGSSDAGVLAVDSQDMEETLNLLQAVGESANVRDANHIGLSVGRTGYSHKGSFLGRIRELGLWKNKHIPDLYMRADTSQRLALLQGLMDSDGSVRRGGHARFCNTNQRLLQQAEELLISLGYHVKRAKIQITDNPRVKTPCGTISFRATQDMNPFRISRKATLVAGTVSSTRTRLRSIVKIEPVESVPVRCISVAAEDRLFLAGRGMHSTRNTHQWVDGNGGPDMYRAISRNLAKTRGARAMAITNAYMPGEGSVGELMRSDWEKAGTNGRSTKLMYDSVEADPRAPIVGPLVPVVVEEVRGDADWLDTESIQDEMAIESIDVSMSRRFWLNQIITSDDRIYGPEDWDHLGSLSYKLNRGDRIALGFDGGKSDDATALIAIRLKDLCAFPLGIWEMERKRPDEKRIIDREEVDAMVRQAFNFYDVHAFYADVAEWEPWILEWTKDFADQLGVKASERSPIGLDMRGNQSRIVPQHEAMIQAIRQGRIKHDESMLLRKHLLNVEFRTSKYGMSFGKTNPNKIDAYAAMLLAFMAATDAMIRSKKETEVRRGRTFLL